MTFKDKREDANQYAKEVLEQARLACRRVTDEEVKLTLEKWEFKRNIDRKNVLPKGKKYVLSETFGLVRTRTGHWMSSSCTRAAPYVPKLLNVWLNDRLEDTNFLTKEVPNPMGSKETKPLWLCSSITVNKDFASRRHVDRGNVGPSVIRSFGDHNGGDLLYWPNDDGSVPQDDLAVDHAEVLDVACPKTLVCYDGKKAHEVRPFSGNRFSIIFFTSNSSWNCPKAERNHLEGSEFTVPRREHDLELFKGIASENNESGVPRKDGLLIIKVKDQAPGHRNHQCFSAGGTLCDDNAEKAQRSMPEETKGDKSGPAVPHSAQRANELQNQLSGAKPGKRRNSYQ